MGKKTVNFNKAGIDKLRDDKPVFYRIQTRSGNDNYVGVAGKGNVRGRIAVHLDKIPGSKVVIETFHRKREAEKKEANVIKRSQPPYNEKGK